VIDLRHDRSLFRHFEFLVLSAHAAFGADGQDNRVPAGIDGFHSPLETRPFGAEVEHLGLVNGQTRRRGWGSSLDVSGAESGRANSVPPGSSAPASAASVLPGDSAPGCSWLPFGSCDDGGAGAYP